MIRRKVAYIFFTSFLIICLVFVRRDDAFAFEQSEIVLRDNMGGSPYCYKKNGWEIRSEKFEKKSLANGRRDRVGLALQNWQNHVVEHGATEEVEQLK